MIRAAVYLAKTLREIFPAFLFFFIMFHILLVTRTLMLQQFGIAVPMSAVAVIGALVVAKVVFIAGRIPFLNQYPEKPLIYNVLTKTAVYFLVAMLFLALEEFVHISLREKGLLWTWQNISSRIIWPIFWVRQIWLFILLLFYCSSSELIRAIGKDKVREIFFGRHKV
ncbi:MAG: hypothetical protein NC938_06010 [Candidatus Omnitrophica bacterium]|nr:hypothetical protein [Candidatus Omnitrophota bacterium]MCM8791231.1 hypothetical protein [Candidatus Omnitrophota bacterium]